MTKRTIAIIIIAIIITALIAACSTAKANYERSYTDFEGKYIGVIPGSLTVDTTEIIKAIPQFYSDSSSAIEDMRRGRIEGFMEALTIVKIMASTLGTDTFVAIPVPKEIFSYGTGAISRDQSVIDRFNTFLIAITEDGTLAEMQNRWLGESVDLDAQMPDIQNHGENGVVTVATTPDIVPYAYIGENGTFKGFSVELALRFGAYEGKTIEFIAMEFGGLIPYIISGKADISITGMAITEERKQSVLFSEPYFYEQHGILALRTDGDVSPDTDENALTIMRGRFIEWVKTGIERNLLTDNRWLMIVDGLRVTMTIAFFAQIFGTFLGFFVCWLLTRKSKLVKWFSNFYCGLIHGTPIVVLLMITYYIIFGHSSISNVLIAIIAFSFIIAAGIAQNLKGAIETVDPVEIEAARSIGFSSTKAFLLITFPQAIQRALPGYTKGFVELVKATAIVGYIAI
ncbi:MAG: ABC transporter permease subunit, partial [Oscillospiraceae bacterium]|nr:ABC transporter permease subunit [Oscillospiraceae bacterium]